MERRKRKPCLVLFGELLILLILLIMAVAYNPPMNVIELIGKLFGVMVIFSPIALLVFAVCS